MEIELKEPKVLDPPMGIFFAFLFGFWVGWGTLIFRQLVSELMLLRLLAALVGGYILMMLSLSLLAALCTGWSRPMTPEERAEWESENAERAAKILAAREAHEGKLRQVKSKITQLIAEIEADPAVAPILRTARRDTSKEMGEELLANAGVAIAGLGAWLTDQGVPNQLPGHVFEGQAKGKIEEHFSSLSAKEKAALQKYLPRVVQVLEKALEVMSSEEAVKEILLPLFFGETANQTQDK